METILSSPSISPFLNPKPSSQKTLFSPSLHVQQQRSSSLFCSKNVTCSVKKHNPESLKQFSPIPRRWFTHAQQGLAALALSLALNFSPLLYSGGNALASEFDVLNEVPPKDAYVVDDAGVLSRVTRSDLKQLLSDLESRKNFHINFITVRKLTVRFLVFFILLMCLFMHLLNFGKKPNWPVPIFSICYHILQMHPFVLNLMMIL